MQVVKTHPPGIHFEDCVLIGPMVLIVLVLCILFDITPNHNCQPAVVQRSYCLCGRKASCKIILDVCLVYSVSLTTNNACTNVSMLLFVIC